MPSNSKADLTEEAISSSAEQVSGVQSAAISDTTQGVSPILISDVSLSAPETDDTLLLTNTET